ncbi:MAG TPA: AAA family ATPase [Flavobacterium sp.]|nr:AAA family ATPase [Flavobacterium sp.]
MQNAFYGYSFQKLVTTMILAKMDAERVIESIEIEALVDHKFDDIRVISSDKEFFFQIKDFATISLNDIAISDTEVTIAKKRHKLSTAINVLFFNRIEITPDCEILGLPALQLKNIYIVSQSGLEIDQKIEELYKTNHLRKYIIDQFFSDCLDKRKLLIKISDLPTLNVFKTYLIEPTVNVTREVLKIENILLIEGKPGVGKSHLVISLEKQYKNNIVYRFWVSNQDSDYQGRLKYNNFIQDFSKKLFRNLKPYTETQVIEKLTEQKKIVIIDGLDHVENYNPNELELYITFINNLMEYCKVIVLSRPLQRVLPWKKQLLGNWNHKQTKTVLSELYNIQDYNTIQKIFDITDGYPIFVTCSCPVVHC